VSKKDDRKSEKSASLIAALLDMPDDDDEAGINEDDDTDIAAFAPVRPGVGQRLPRLVLDAATPKRIARRLVAGKPLADIVRQNGRTKSPGGSP